MLPDDHHMTTPTASKSPSTTTAWSTMLGWACPNWLTGAWTWAIHQAEPTRALRS